MVFSGESSTMLESFMIFLWPIFLHEVPKLNRFLENNQKCRNNLISNSAWFPFHEPISSSKTNFKQTRADCLTECGQTFQQQFSFTSVLLPGCRGEVLRGFARRLSSMQCLVNTGELLGSRVEFCMVLEQRKRWKLSYVILEHQGDLNSCQFSFHYRPCRKHFPAFLSSNGEKGRKELESTHEKVSILSL